MLELLLFIVIFNCICYEFGVLKVGTRRMENLQAMLSDNTGQQHSLIPVFSIGTHERTATLPWRLLFPRKWRNPIYSVYTAQLFSKWPRNNALGHLLWHERLVVSRPNGSKIYPSYWSLRDNIRSGSRHRSISWRLREHRLQFSALRVRNFNTPTS